MTNPVGRPLKFKSVEDLQELVTKYFETTPECEWTITGLALALDTSRETLMNYEAREDFFDTIKRAKLKVHNAYEKDLRKKGRSGDIFALKNFGWIDKQEVSGEVIHTDKKILIIYGNKEIDGNKNTDNTPQLPNRNPQLPSKVQGS